MRLLITGATGQLGPYVVRQLLNEGHQPVLWARQTHAPLFDVPVRSVDLTDATAVGRAFALAAPQAVLHCAAISSIDRCFKEPEAAAAINVTATQTLVRLCDEHDARLIYCSTDLVFDGEQSDSGGYTEADQASPLSNYGRTKLAGEAPVLASRRHTVVRLPMLFGPTLLGDPRFTDTMIRKLRSGEKVTLFDDEYRTAIAVDIAAEGLIRAAAGPSSASTDAASSGLFHLGGQYRLSRHAMGLIVGELLGLNASLIEAKSRLSMTAGEPRPADTSLCSNRWYDVFPDCRRESFAQSIERLFGDG